MKRIVTSLQNEIFEFGEYIIQEKNHVIGVIFVKEHGVTVLGINESVRLLDFYE